MATTPDGRIVHDGLTCGIFPDTTCDGCLVRYAEFYRHYLDARASAASADVIDARLRDTIGIGLGELARVLSFVTTERHQAEKATKGAF